MSTENEMDTEKAEKTGKADGIENAKNTVLPLINSLFQPGHAREKVESFRDKSFRDIALGELYYFSGEAQKCSDTVEIYLMSPRLELKLSACMLYTYSNLTLGNARASRRGLEEIKECVKKELTSPTSRQNTAYCVFAGYLGAVLLHLPAKGLPDMKHFMADLPHGLRIYATYVMAHELYLKGEYGRALGLCDAALFFCEGTYPISMIYLNCMTAMCEISLKRQTEAQKALLTAWHIAAKDELLEPFIEHHGLLQGLLESCVRKENPEIYKKMSEAVIAFSRGWMAVHNPSSGRTVTDALTTMEFSIAMLACRDWSNQEIADHLGMSVNTVKHYISDIFDKLHVRKRDELKDFVLK
mgnify:CR=1 FL=1